MGYKIKHYGSKSIALNYRLNIEGIVIETCIGIICTIFAISGYKSEMILLFLPTAIVAVTCFLLVLHSLYLYVSSIFVRKSPEIVGRK